MKKLLFVLCVVLLSCEKEGSIREETIINNSTYCWQCWRDWKNDVGYYSLEIDFCDMTEAQINNIIKLNTWYNYDSTRYLILRCQKKE